MGRIKFPNIFDECRKPWNFAEFEFGRKIGLYRIDKCYLFNYADADSLYPAVDLFKGGRCIATPLLSSNFIRSILMQPRVERPVSFSEFFRLTADPYYGTTRRNILKEEG